MAERELQQDMSAVAVTEEVGLGDVQVPEQGDGILRGLPEGERAVHVRGVAVSLLLERDHLSRLRDERDELAKRGLDGGAAPMEQHERDAVLRRFAADLVVELEPVHGRVPGGREHQSHDAHVLRPPSSTGSRCCGTEAGARRRSLPGRRACRNSSSRG